MRKTGFRIQDLGFRAGFLLLTAYCLLPTVLSAQQPTGQAPIPDAKAVFASSTLGNASTVIDVASAFPSAWGDFSQRVNAAISYCAVRRVNCRYDLGGFSGSLTMSQSITFPAGSDWYFPLATITRNSGMQFILNNYIHVHGPASGFTTIKSANITSDYSPVFYAPSYVAFVEIDHLAIGPTTPSGLRLALTSVANSSGGNAVYTGTGLGSACSTAGTWYGVWGFSGTHNEGYFPCVSATSTTLTMANPQATAETPTLVGGAFATQMGGWGIWGEFQGSNIHDVNMTSDLGLQFAPSGCTCYNYFWNLNLQTQHGALYFGANANANQGTNVKAWAGDQGTLQGSLGGLNGSTVALAFANATGYSLRINNATGIEINGLDSENTKYSAVVRGAWIKITNFGLENDFKYGAGPAGAVSLPTIQRGATNVVFDPSLPVVDNGSTSTKPLNSYGYPGTRNLLYGSITLQKVAAPGQMYARVHQGSGRTAISYWAVPVDYNGNKGLPLSLGSPANQTLGPYTLTLTQATPSGAQTVYTGTITGGASGGLNGNSFTIAGFTNRGNNGTFTCPTSTSTTLACNNSAGASETNSATASSDASNALSITGQTGVSCYDILKGDPSHSLVLCMPPSLVPYYDDGSVATVSGYTAPTWDGTGTPIFAGSHHTPASSSEACTQGMWTWDASYIYVCKATNSWVRTALSSF